jgi:hypothetical protein
MLEKGATALLKRTADPATIANDVGVEYALATGDVCTRGTAPELKQRGFDDLWVAWDAARAARG